MKMNFKKIILLGLCILLSVPIINVSAFTYVDYIKDGNYVFFLVDIEDGNSVEFNVTHEGSGNFTLFLFNQRPTESHIILTITLILILQPQNLRFIILK